MLNTLLPLHEMLEKTGPTTLKEIAFVQSYGREVGPGLGARRGRTKKAARRAAFGDGDEQLHCG